MNQKNEHDKKSPLKKEKMNTSEIPAKKRENKLVLKKISLLRKNLFLIFFLLNSNIFTRLKLLNLYSLVIVSEILPMVKI